MNDVYFYADSFIFDFLDRKNKTKSVLNLMNWQTKTIGLQNPTLVFGYGYCSELYPPLKNLFLKYLSMGECNKSHDMQLACLKAPIILTFKRVFRIGYFTCGG